MNGDDSGSYSTNLRVPTHAILIPCSSYLCQDIIPVCSHEHSLLSSLPPSPSPVTVRLTCVLLHLLRLPIRYVSASLSLFLSLSFLRPYHHLAQSRSLTANGSGIFLPTGWLHLCQRVMHPGKVSVRKICQAQCKYRKQR